MSDKFKVLVLCSDKIPSTGNATSGGGLRSLQIINLMSDLGCDVSFVTPENSAQQLTKVEYKFLGEYNLSNQKELVTKENFNLIYWCNPGTVDSSIAAEKKYLSFVDFHGPCNLESIHITGENLKSCTRRILQNLIHCDKFTFVSNNQRNFWIGALTSVGIDPAQSFGPIINLSSKEFRLDYRLDARVKFVFGGGWHPWLMDESLLLSAAETIENLDNSSLHILGGPHQFCQHKYSNLEGNLRSLNNTHFEGFLSHTDYSNFLTNGSCLLDIFSQSFERKIAISTRSFETISLGVPLIHPSWSELSHDIEHFGNGWVYKDESSLIKNIINIDSRPELLLKASSKSLAANKSMFDYDNSLKEMRECFRVFKIKTKKLALPNKQIKRFHIFSNKKPAILCLTPSNLGDPLSQLRIESVLTALYYKDQISGFMILGADRSIVCGENLSCFDAVLMQREGSLNSNLLNEIKGYNYLLDVDDLLLASASYRLAEYSEWKKRFYNQFLSNISNAKSISVTSKRLDRLLKKYSKNLGKYETFVVENGLFIDSSIPAQNNKVEAILWTSSDIAALTETKQNVISAVNDFSIKYNLPIFCFGRFPNTILEMLNNKKYFGKIDFHLHKQILRNLSGRAISISPLETSADPETLDFISGKSDLKMVEYGGCGINGVYSKSPPYTESSLLEEIIVKNTYKDWFSGLESALSKPSLTSDQVSKLVTKRSIDIIATDKWMPAIKSSELTKALPLSMIEKLNTNNTVNIQKPLIKRVWKNTIPKCVRKKLDPYLQPIFG